MFLSPGERMVGRKGRRGQGDTFIGWANYAASQTISIPLGASRAKVWLWGASSGTSTFSAFANAGGGLFKFLTGLTPGNTLSLTIGAGGADSATAGAGGVTTLASGSQPIATLTANGGTTSAGGTATGGDLNITGIASGSVFAGAPVPFCFAFLPVGTGHVGISGGCFIEWMS